MNTELQNLSRRILACLFAASALTANAAFTPGTITTNIEGSDRTMHYSISVPAGYTPGTPIPLVVYLHGNGNQGNTPWASIPSYVDFLADPATQGAHPAIVLYPRAPEGSSAHERQWSNVNFFTGSPQAQVASTIPQELLMALIARVETDYAIDTTRRFLFGFSMGGYGTWDIIARHPDMFEAAVPQSGGGDTTAIAATNTRVWAVHGTADAIVPVDGSRLMVQALESAGKSPLYSEVVGAAHLQTLYLPIPRIYDWLFLADNERVVMLPGQTGDAEVSKAVTGVKAEGDGGATAINAAAQPIQVGSRSGGQTGYTGAFFFDVSGLPAGETVTDACFGVTTGDKIGGFAMDIDLYSLGTQATATAVAADYYIGASDPTNATLVQAAMLGTGTGAKAQAYSSTAAGPKLMEALDAPANSFLALRTNTRNVRGSGSGTVSGGWQLRSAEEGKANSLILWLRKNPPLSYSEFRAATDWGSIPESQRDKDDDPDGDGRSNFLEFAFGFDPTLSDAPGATTFDATEQGYESLLFVVSYKKAVPSLTYLVEQSAALPGWSTSGVSEEILNENTEIAQRQYTVPSTESSHFFRVAVSESEVSP